MIRLLVTILTLAAPLPALALSCLAPTIEGSFARYAAAEEAYVVVNGRLTLDQTRMPEGMTETTPPRMTHVAARLSGTFLNKKGFVLPFDKEVTLEVSCVGPWCGQIQNDTDVLAFLRKDTQGYALAIGPCGGAAFSAPDPAMLKRVTQCLVRRDCSAD
ncbi:hypothetical protein OS190_02820 [Sulfitobacter sp. F26204]|uniref:hypothetical protein n=1 Tax=Sulfitobacter sp. F26204 TaxID=2996014 RepID=UPI00225E5A44|nr:hypothetical protein [Sulfitobacter sp. F26204]MCX7558484.1 hypothetical protein [Sulfitobacter sp. F26204]